MGAAESEAFFILKRFLRSRELLPPSI